MRENRGFWRSKTVQKAWFRARCTVLAIFLQSILILSVAKSVVARSTFDFDCLAGAFLGAPKFAKIADFGVKKCAKSHQIEFGHQFSHFSQFNGSLNPNFIIK